MIYVGNSFAMIHGYIGLRQQLTGRMILWAGAAGAAVTAAAAAAACAC